MQIILCDIYDIKVCTAKQMRLEIKPYSEWYSYHNTEAFWRNKLYIFLPLDVFF